MKCETVIQEYSTTTINLDIFEENSKSSIFTNICSRDTLKDLESKDWIRYLKATLPRDVSRLISIILGESDEGFETWSLMNEQLVSEDPKRIAVQAMEYLGLDSGKVKQMVQEALVA